MRAIAMVLIVTTASAFAPRVLAQNDKAGAEVLLQQGIALAKAGKLAEACPKMEESLKLYPSINTKYHLADCYERSGKIASAYIEFQEVADKAKANGETAKETKARERAAAIASRVSHLKIEVPKPVAGLEIKRGGLVVGKGTWGTELPIDNGSYEIVASAPGYETFKTTIVIKTDGAHETLTVPALTAAPVAPAPVASAPSTVSDAGSSGRKTIGLVVAGAGLVTVGIGGFLGLSAKSQYDGAQCTGASCSQAGADDRDAARGKGNVATILIGVGGALLIGGAVLWLTAPSAASAPKTAGSNVTLRAGITPTGFVLGGSF